MKTKLIITLTALLMLVGINVQAQVSGQTTTRAESTELEGDLNHDGKVNVADVTYLVDLIMKQSTSGYYWYFGVGDLTEDNAPNNNNIYTYDDPGLGWYALDTSVNSFNTPTARLNNDRLPWVIALPVASGFNQLENALGPVDDYIWTTSYITIDGVQYIVFKQNNDADHATKLDLKVTKNGTIDSKANYWYFGVGDLTETDVPSAPIYTYDNQGLGWYILDTSVNSFETPTAKLNNDHLPWVIALPVASGFNQLQDALGPVDTINEWNISYITINGVQYIVFKLNDGYYSSYLSQIIGRQASVSE